MNLRCQRCSLETPEELIFCLRCRSRLAPRSGYDLTIDDFAYGPDRDAIQMMKATGILPYLVKHLALADFENRLRSKLSSDGRKITYPSQLDELLRHSANLFSLDVLPELFVIDIGQPTAFTFGSENQAYVVIDASAVTLLSNPELTALISHELGHIKSGHMLYHTLAELLGGGISFSASYLGLGILSLPVRLALLSWHRQSEVTADRAGLLAVNDIGVIKSFMNKLALRASGGLASRSSYDIENEKVGTLESISELLRTHPAYVNRFRLVKEFWGNEQFLTARKKIDLRLGVIRALIPVCRFCGASKPVSELFCPNCGRCQT